MNRVWFTPLILAAALAGWLLAQGFEGHEGVNHVMSLARTLFLEGLKLVIAPLIFFSLISGILRLGGAADMRRLGGVTVTYYVLTTGIAICIGLFVVLFVHPWTEYPPLPLDAIPATDGLTLLSATDTSFGALINGLAERMLVNPFRALADLNILGIVTNALLFGLAALFVLDRHSPLIASIHGITEIVYRVAGWIVLLAPIGVMGIVFHLANSVDVNVVTQLVSFSLVVLAATAFHALIVLPAIAWFAAGRSPLTLLRHLGRPMFVALTTSSSAATLPVSMNTAEEGLGVSRSVYSFVLPLGATINMDGTALFEGIAAVFLAYLFGIELGMVGMLAVFFVAMISSVGAPGVPSGSMAGMQMVLLAVGIPLEAIGLLLLIERPLDTFRTAVNVQGDLIACTVAQAFTAPSTGEGGKRIG